MSDEEAEAMLVKIRWPSEIRCPYCNSARYTGIRGSQRKHCNVCNTSFSVTVGTLFHGTKLGLGKWFSAIGVIINGTERISGRQLAKNLGVNKATGCRVVIEVAAALHNPNQRHMLLAIASDLSATKEMYT